MWIGDKYIYSKSLLKNIAENYLTIYDGLPVSWRADIYVLMRIAEYRADFIMSFNKLGQFHNKKPPHWDGELKPFKYFKPFSRSQKIIIADILKIETLPDYYNPEQLKSRAYTWMLKYLNNTVHKLAKARNLQ